MTPDNTLNEFQMSFNVRWSQSYTDNGKRTYCSYQFTFRGGNKTKHPGLIGSFNTHTQKMARVTYPSETVALVERLQSSKINVVGGSSSRSEEFNHFEGASLADSCYSHIERDHST